MLPTVAGRPIGALRPSARGPGTCHTRANRWAATPLTPWATSARKPTWRSCSPSTRACPTRRRRCWPASSGRGCTAPTSTAASLAATPSPDAPTWTWSPCSSRPRSTRIGVAPRTSSVRSPDGSRCWSASGSASPTSRSSAPRRSATAGRSSSGSWRCASGERTCGRSCHRPGRRRRSMPTPTPSWPVRGRPCAPRPIPRSSGVPAGRPRAGWCRWRSRS